MTLARGDAVESLWAEHQLDTDIDPLIIACDHAKQWPLANTSARRTSEFHEVDYGEAVAFVTI